MSNKKIYKLYICGGYVRDKLLGIKSKDIDYSFEFTQEFTSQFTTITPDMFYERMNEILEKEGFEIFLETPDCFTTRARFPKGHRHEKLTADFVMCRKETYPQSDSRKPKVEVGTLFDDLRRRDFTMNAIAEDEDGNLIDPFNGIQDIRDKIIRCPIDAETSFNDDPLRMLRALRFSITKDFDTCSDIDNIIISDTKMWSKFSEVVSQERIREEVYKMMKHDTVRTIQMLSNYHEMNGVINILGRIFAEGMWLKPTTEKK